VEDYLEGVPEGEREALRRELLRVEAELRARCAGADSVRDLETTRSYRPGAAPGPIASGPTSTGSAPLPDIPGYAIEGVLGKGGMGVVYKARHLALKRTVALKMILAADHAGEQERLRFKTEAEAMARLQHPHIIQVFEVGEHQGLPFCALEFVDGVSLDKKLKEQPLPPRQAAQLVATLADAMHLAHSRNVVHRDLKPANVLLTSDGVPKVTDFGLARQLDSDSGQTRPDAVMGTPSYMAPEQAAGQTREAGPAADIYALGAVLYACLTGRPPFQGSNVMETLDQVRQKEPVAPRLWQPKVPRDLETICLKCLRKQPEKRYASAQELGEDLRRFQKGEPIQARPVGWFEKLWRWCYRHPTPATAAGVILATVVTAFVIVMQSRNQEVEAKNAAVTLANEKANLAENNGKLAQQERELRQKVQRQAANTLWTEGLYSCERGDVARGTLLY
jgi:serine/threonine-protein kinase